MTTTKHAHNRQGPEAVFKRVIVRSNDCWEWIGSLNKDGYGTISVGGKIMKSHRAAFLAENGYLPKVVQHECDNTRCCNPNHLVAGTVKSNHADMVKKCRHGRTRITPSQVVYIRESTKRCIDLAKELGVNKSYISRVRNGVTLSSVGKS